MTTSSPPRFTRESATAALRLIGPIVRELRLAFDALQRHGRQGSLRSVAESGDLPPEIRSGLTDVGALLTELQELGVRVEDPELGLVALPGRLEGTDVQFCWKLGEPEVRYWYPEGGSYDQRRPVSCNPLQGSRVPDGTTP